MDDSASKPANTSGPRIDAVVAMLRTIHELRSDGAKKSKPDRAEAIKEIVKALAGIHDAGGGNIPRITGYESTFRQFYAFQKHLTKQKAAMDRLLNGVFGPPGTAQASSPVFQQTVNLQGQRGGNATGWFRTINRTKSRARVSFGEPFVHADGGRSDEHIPVSFSPDTAELEPNENIAVRVDIDLNDTGTSGPMLISTSVLMNEEITVKLWLSVDVYDE